MTQGMDNVQTAEVCLPSTDLAADLAFYTHELGFRLDMIFPADDPAWRLPGFEARETGIGAATAGVASVQVARPVSRNQGPTIRGQVTSHTSDILFGFVLSGSLTLWGEGQGSHTLGEGDAYVIPPHLKTALTDCSADLALLEVSLPAEFETHVHPEFAPMPFG